jgi:betaine-aldehyde dehydrogenase
VCTNGTRVFVPAKRKAEFEHKILERVAASAPAICLPMTPTSARWSASPSRQRSALYRERQREGARLLCGGEALKGDGFDNGAWVAPTVFTDCSDEMTIVREEIFGPVMSILSYTDEAEVIRRANATEYGLAAGVVTPNLNRAHRLSTSWKPASAGSTAGGIPGGDAGWRL